MSDMPRITIDGETTAVASGATILDAAKQLGVEIPTLCHLDGCKPSTSCLVCIVKVGGKLVPSCATKVVDGMVVESDTDEVRAARRSALELLVSEHVGDCSAPCQFSCPATMDIPRMLRRIAANDLHGAIETIKNDIPLPAVLGRTCPAPCEANCRLKGIDSAVAICDLKRYVADWDLAQDTPYRPECEASTGKRVAILGAGPAALSAAYYLRRLGHAVTMLNEQSAPGGRLREEKDLPLEVLDAEINTILSLGVELVNDWRGDVDTVIKEHDALLLACGPVDEAACDAWGLQRTQRGVEIDGKTYATSREGLFAAGNVVRKKCLVIRATADGKEAAIGVHQYVTGRPVTGATPLFSVRIGKLGTLELEQLAQLSTRSDRREGGWRDGNEFTREEASAQSARCLHCDCRAPGKCLLKAYAEEYGVDVKAYNGERASVELNVDHAFVVYEPGKCIKCGLCVQITAEEKDSLGLTFIGRGFNVRVGSPFDHSLQMALGRLADQCVEACPTAALAYREDDR